MALSLRASLARISSRLLVCLWPVHWAALIALRLLLSAIGVHSDRMRSLVLNSIPGRGIRRYRYSDDSCPLRASVAPFGLIDGLGDEPLLDADAFPFHPAVHAALPALQAEARQILTQECPVYGWPFNAWPPRDVEGAIRGALVNDRRFRSVGEVRKWKWWPLFANGAWVDDQRAKVTPVGHALARAIVAACPLTLNVVYMVLEPGARIRGHVDLFNGFVNYWAVLLVDKEGSGLSVGNKILTLRQGQLFGFDNSFRHSGWNLSASPRVVFATYTSHPDLTACERRELQRLQSLVTSLVTTMRWFFAVTHSRQRR